MQGFCFRDNWIDEWIFFHVESDMPLIKYGRNKLLYGHNKVVNLLRDHHHKRGKKISLNNTTLILHAKMIGFITTIWLIFGIWVVANSFQPVNIVGFNLKLKQ